MRNEEIFIHEVGRTVGIELELDVDNTCSLVVDDRVLTVKYRPDADDWLMFGVVVDSGADELSPETLSRVLEASLFGVKTKGFVPGRCGNAILLSGRVNAASAQPEGFADALVLLSGAVGDLARLVQGDRDVPDEESADGAEGLRTDDLLRI